MMALFSLIPDTVKNWVIIALAGLVVVGGPLLHLYSVSHGKSLEAAKQARATVKQIEKRNEINEYVDKLDDCELVIELGGVCDD